MSEFQEKYIRMKQMYEFLHKSKYNIDDMTNKYFKMADVYNSENVLAVVLPDSINLYYTPTIIATGGYNIVRKVEKGYKITNLPSTLDLEIDDLYKNILLYNAVELDVSDSIIRISSCAEDEDPIPKVVEFASQQILHEYIETNLKTLIGYNPIPLITDLYGSFERDISKIVAIMKYYEPFESLPSDFNTLKKFFNTLFRISIILKEKINFTHGDFKLGNILVNERNLPMIIDFGFSYYELRNKSEYISYYTLSYEQHVKNNNFSDIPFLISHTFYHFYKLIPKDKQENISVLFSKYLFRFYDENMAEQIELFPELSFSSKFIRLIQNLSSTQLYSNEEYLYYFKDESHEDLNPKALFNYDKAKNIVMKKIDFEEIDFEEIDFLE